MENKASDVFEFTTEGNSLARSNSFEEGNPFMNMSLKQERSRHLNDYDFNILKEGAYRDISDDVFKLEYKIARAENEIRNLEAQIDAASEIQDSAKISELQEKLYTVKDDYQTLLSIYNDKTLSAKITDSFSNFVEKSFGTNLNDIKNSVTNVCEALISKMPNKFSSAFKIKKSLSLLENINKSVDELVTMTIPYGENIDKYKQLSKYILKANSIQSEIAGYLGKRG